MKNFIKSLTSAVEVAGKVFVTGFRSIKQCVMDKCEMVSSGKVQELQNQLDKQKSEFERIISESEEEKKRLHEQLIQAESVFREETARKDTAIGELSHKFGEEKKHLTERMQTIENKMNHEKERLNKKISELERELKAKDNKDN